VVEVTRNHNSNRGVPIPSFQKDSYFIGQKSMGQGFKKG
jgi:hypothetical protein